ncbi:MAG: hypothetical protein ACFFD8_01135 [Candidatus Thorarchaeota archaeon]
MGRSLVAVLVGIFSVVAFTLLAGITSIPLSIAMWLPFMGFILCCLIIGVVGRLRALHLVLLSLIIYLGLMIFLATNSTLFVGLTFGPLSMDQIQQAWNGFQVFVNNFIPFLGIISNYALMLRFLFGDSLLAIFLEFTVASLFTGFVGLLITGIGGYLTRPSPLHVVTAPEPSIDTTNSSAVPTEPQALPPVAVSDVFTAETYAQPPASQAPMEAPPPPPAPRPIEDGPPSQPTPKGGSPSAQAIAGLKGKVKKHLKGTGQKVPVGQSRCPHCNATIIRGSQFCNACEKEI